MNTRQLRRQSIIQQIRNTIDEKTNDGELLDYNKLIAKVCLDTGVSRRTVKEYLDILIDSEQVFLKSGMVFSNAEKVFHELQKASLKKDPYDFNTYTKKELLEFLGNNIEGTKSFDIDRMSLPKSKYGEELRKQDNKKETKE